MTYKPISFSMPGAGIISTLAKQYETLTDAFIQQWLYDLVIGWMAVPDYLLVSTHVREELHHIMMSDRYIAHWAMMHSLEDKGGWTERYPNKVTGTPLTIVVFPGLPEKTLFVASTLSIAEEEVRVDGPVRTVTRFYAKQEQPAHGGQQ